MTEPLDLDALEAEHRKGDGNWCWADQHEYPCLTVRLIGRLRAAEGEATGWFKAAQEHSARAEAAEARVAELERLLEMRLAEAADILREQEASRD